MIRRTASILPPAITIGFGTAVVMWLVGFFTHLPAIRLPAEWVAAGFFAIQAAGGFMAGRSTDRRSALIVGVLAGLITAALNLLIVGSVVADADQTNTLRPGWPLIIGGSFLFSGIISGGAAVLAARLGQRQPSHHTSHPLPTSRLWLARFSLVATASALPVLLSGGLVTSTGTGLAVPDWPTSYNANMFLYPLAKMTGGIYYEHAHRLFGSLVGLTTLTLFLFILIADPRRWVKALGLFAFLCVCGQGYLGGLRVTAANTLATGAPADNKASLMLAMIHGITAQLFFALLAAIAAILSVRWLTLDRARSTPDRTLRTVSLLLFIALVIQLSMGSAARHLNQAHALWTHVGFAVIVLVCCTLAGFRAIARSKATPKATPTLRRLGHAIVHTVGLQLVLGIVTLLLVLPYQPGKVDPPATVLLATAHQATGALLIGVAAMLAAWALLINSAGAHPPNRLS